MGVDFNCGDISFGCSYGGWAQIRFDVIKATIEYILDKYEKDKELYGHLDENDDNYIGEGTYYYVYKKCIIELSTILSRNQSLLSIAYGTHYGDTVNTFNTWCANLDNMNALHYFNIGGLRALCNQSDCEGCYTPGNSLDICLLFDKIKPFVKKYDSYDVIYIQEGTFHNVVYDVFEYSYQTMKNVIIC